MNKIFKLFALFFAITLTVFSIQSCSEDGDWENTNGGQFGFSIVRDTDFIEKAVGETNQFKFNLVTNYNFSSLDTKFKFTTNLSGVLKLNGVVLVPNKEYTFTNKDNVFEYTGNAAGSHTVNITVSNSKGASKEEKMEFKYEISDFALTFVGGTADIYQGDETTYIHKITPSNPQNASGYEVRFDTYNGDIKFNGVPAQLGQFYPISNITNFSISLKTNQVGQNDFTYTVKNSNSSKPYTITQTIKPRQIVIESANPSSLNVVPNTPMTMTGIITKSPSTSNNNIKYKTWISSATNNQMNGIESTNNVYTPYALNGNGAFTIPFKALQTGTYTYNIQAQDEFGNESNIKSSTIVVGFPLAFVGNVSATVHVTRINPTGNYNYNITGFSRSFEVQADPAKISSIEYKLSCYFDGVGTVNGQPAAGQKEFTYSDIINLQNNVTYSNDMYSMSNGALGFATHAGAISNLKLKIKVTANDGTTAEKEIVPTIIYN
ncbi:TraQ conjugal transfer family protein [Chryseobacterium oncorhynchi]|uniref:Uncharacterized protein n=1 Tax=Chryseobacterium oncorhynchi TaxID=741074 RepID=A0A316WDS1_9FLAO|nr:TraQ conjugal transfer family protein [Chryseobacterium oncorhynchi]PWN59582.1 hypothetical protein C1638_021505 [Chryseobacterium oncorhynchi]